MRDRLCSSHSKRWRERGCPEMTFFVADPGPEISGRRDLTACKVTGCRYGASGLGLCVRHRPVFERSGESDQNAWVARAGHLGPPDPVQCRRDQATITAPPPIVAWTIHLAMGAGVTSLLDRSPEQWRVLAAGKQAMYQRFLSDARDAVETLHGVPAGRSSI